MLLQILVRWLLGTDHQLLHILHDALELPPCIDVWVDCSQTRIREVAPRDGGQQIVLRPERRELWLPVFALKGRVYLERLPTNFELDRPSRKELAGLFDIPR